MSELSPPPVTVAALIAPGLAAVKKYWRPFLLLQGAALLLVVMYYTNDRVKTLCEQLSQFRQHAGLIFSAVSAAIAGALLPELAKAIMMGDRAIDRARVGNVGFAVAAFAGAGVIIDFQYREFARLLGYDTHASTIIKKVVVDMFVTTPLYGVPYWLIVYSFRANRYNPVTTLGQISPRWYVTRVLPLLIPAWFFWIPMVSLIYSLPGPLQFCLYCFALAAWSLLMIFVATHEAEERGIEDRE